MTISHKIIMDDDWSAQDISEIALSPDGRRIAFVMTGYDNVKDETLSTIFLLLLDDHGEAIAGPRQLTSGAQKDGCPVWAPDSRRLLFTSDREHGNQLWLLDTDGGEPHKLTNMLYGVNEAAWSPDGQKIAFTAPTLSSIDDDILVGRKNLDEAARQSLAKQEQLHLRPVKRVLSRSDGVGLFERYAHVFVMPAPMLDVAFRVPTEVRRLTSKEDFYHSLLWTPDGREIGILQEASVPDAPLVADLWSIDAENGAARCLTEGTIEAETYSWAPDGLSAMVVGARSTNVQGPGLMSLFLVTRQGNVGDHPLCVSPDFEYAVTMKLGSAFGQSGSYRPQWSADGQKAFFLAAVEGSVRIYQIDVVWRSITQLMSDVTITSNVTLFSDGWYLFTLQAYEDHHKVFVWSKIYIDGQIQ